MQGGAAKKLETFAGTSGSIPERPEPSVRVGQEVLMASGFELHEDFEKLFTPLCKLVEPRKDKYLPLVSPSVEQYGAVVGWQLEEPEALRVNPLVGGGGEGEGGQQQQQQHASGFGPRGFHPPRPLRDRNTYAPYRWMFSPLHERANALEDRLEEMMGAIGSQASAPLETMSVGRICAESEASRVNASSVSLELPKGHNSALAAAGGGASGRMTLDLREVPKFAVFPGQVVGVQGAPTFGDRLSVTQLFTSGAAPYARMPLGNAQALAKVRGRGGPVRVWVAAGPFTEHKDLKFEVLQQLLAEVVGAEEGVRPDVLILQGPFVDADHPAMRAAAPKSIRVDNEEPTVELSFYRDIWTKSVLSILELYLTNEELNGGKVELVLQPSPSDLHLDPVVPQWPMDPSLFDSLDSDALKARITCLPNPATFVVGDLVWGGISVDPVFHLNGEEASRWPGGENRPDRFVSLASHLLEQRSYYPLYPAFQPSEGGGGSSASASASASSSAAALASAAAGGGGGATTTTTPGVSASAGGAVPLEVTQLWHMGMPCSPDVILLPSRLGKPCVRVACGGTVAVNPGSLARNKTFAKVSIHPMAGLEGDHGDITHVSHLAPSRVRVDIERLELVE